MQYTPEHYFHYTKSQWRTWASAWHNSLMQMRRCEWDAAICDALYHYLLGQLGQLPSGQRFNLGMYAPFRGEPNLWPFYQQCVEDDALHALHLFAPRIEANNTLSWHAWHDQQHDATFWEATPHGLKQPAAHLTPAVPHALDAILVPCQMLDATGIRLGYGGGYYDRQFTQWQQQGKLPPQRIGVVYQECVIRELPRDSHDVPLTHHVGEHALTPLVHS